MISFVKRTTDVTLDVMRTRYLRSAREKNRC
jgi:hypothetical protein